jgi:hypothetical protein
MPADVLNVTWTCVENVSYAELQQGAARCQASTGTGSINQLVDLKSEKSITYTVTATSNDYDTYSNTATITAPVGVVDPVLANNTSTVTNEIYALWMPQISDEVYDHLYAPNLIITDFVAGPHGFSVTIKNIGLAPVTSDFWVDVYLDPLMEPTGPNMVPDGYQYGSYGHAQWHVINRTLYKDQTMTLLLTDSGILDPYFAWQNIAWPLPTTLKLWAQVDSYGRDANNNPVWYGKVLETHEIMRTAYDNIVGPINVNPIDPVDP